MCDHLSNSPKFSQWNQYRWNLSVVSDKGATTFLDDGLSCPLFYPPVIKGPFKAWFELAVRTTLLRVRLLTKTECDVLLLTIWKWTYRNLETVCRTPLTKCSGGCRDPGGIIRCQYYWNLDITKGQGTTKIIHHTVSTVNINSFTKVRVQIPNTKNSI